METVPKQELSPLSSSPLSFFPPSSSSTKADRFDPLTFPPPTKTERIDPLHFPPPPPTNNAVDPFDPSSFSQAATKTDRIDLQIFPPAAAPKAARPDSPGFPPAPKAARLDPPGFPHLSDVEFPPASPRPPPAQDQPRRRRPEASIGSAEATEAAVNQFSHSSPAAKAEIFGGSDGGVGGFLPSSRPIRVIQYQQRHQPREQRHLWQEPQPPQQQQRSTHPRVDNERAQPLPVQPTLVGLDEQSSFSSGHSGRPVMSLRSLKVPFPLATWVGHSCLSKVKVHFPPVTQVGYSGH